MVAMRIIDLESRRFISLDEALPHAYFFLAGERIGNSALTATELDSNGQRTIYLARIETRVGELSAMFELPATSEETTRALRENETAVRALDACCLTYDDGSKATRDAESGYWSVFDGAGKQIGAGMTQTDAIALAHKQVAA